MRVLYVLLIFALAFGAPLQLAVAAPMVCQVQEAAASPVTAHTSHGDHHDAAHKAVHADLADSPSLHSNHNAHPAHDAQLASDDAAHICTGLCDGTSCGGTCCPCAQSGVVTAALIASFAAVDDFDVLPPVSASGRTVGSELRPPKSLHS